MRAAFALAALALLAACSSAGGVAPAVSSVSPGFAARHSVVGTYIKHVVIVVQENRSFDNFFSGFPGADGATSGLTHTGKRVPLHLIGFSGPNLDHTWKSALTDWNHGKMNGFDVGEQQGSPSRPLAYARISRKAIAPYWEMAREYVLADRMFPTMFGGSFTAHIDLIAGTTDLTRKLALVDYPNGLPWGCDAPPGTTTSVVDHAREVANTFGPFPCFSQFDTIAQRLDEAKVSWRYYSPSLNAVGPGGGGDLWSAFDAIDYVRNGSDWSNVVSPQTRVLRDATAGKLPAVTWVIPDYLDSDHPGISSNTGPSWVAGVVNAIGRSPDWKSTAIVVLWDDWGGWYDHVPPPQLDFVGLGIRVPCIILSPYAKAHYVSHTRYEFGSILKFIEEAFSLAPIGAPALGYTDTRANSLADALDFGQRPRAFKPIPAPYSPTYFLTRKPSLQPPDSE